MGPVHQILQEPWWERKQLIKYNGLRRSCVCVVLCVWFFRFLLIGSFLSTVAPPPARTPVAVCSGRVAPASVYALSDAFRMLMSLTSMCSYFRWRTFTESVEWALEGMFLFARSLR